MLVLFQEGRSTQLKIKFVAGDEIGIITSFFMRRRLTGVLTDAHLDKPLMETNMY